MKMNRPAQLPRRPLQPVDADRLADVGGGEDAELYSIGKGEQKRWLPRNF